MTVVDIGGIVFQVIVILLILLFILSFTLFIRRMLITQKKKAEDSMKMDQKLDKIIELLEQEKSNK